MDPQPADADSAAHEHGALVIDASQVVGDDVLRDMAHEFTSGGIDIRVSRREEGPWASLSLLIPTAVVLFLTKPFLEAILTKAGEDAYPHLKKALLRVIRRGASIRLIVVGKQPAASAARYSEVISFYSTLNDGRVVKFLVRKDASDEEYHAGIEAMLELLSRHFARERANELQRLSLAARNPRWTLLLEFDAQNRSWIPVDPFPGRG